MVCECIACITVHMCSLSSSLCLYAYCPCMQEYKLSQDLNRLDMKRTYQGKFLHSCSACNSHLLSLSLSLSLTHSLTHSAHSNRATALKFIADEDWLLSVGRDKYFQWHCTKTGRKLGSFEAHAWCLAVEYPFVYPNSVHHVLCVFMYVYVCVSVCVCVYVHVHVCLCCVTKVPNLVT